MRPNLSEIVQAIILFDPQERILLGYGVACNGSSTIPMSQKELLFVQKKIIPILTDGNGLILQFHMETVGADFVYLSLIVQRYRVIFFIHQEHYIKLNLMLIEIVSVLAQRNIPTLGDLKELLLAKLFYAYPVTNCETCEEKCIPKAILLDPFQ